MFTQTFRFFLPPHTKREKETHVPSLISFAFPILDISDNVGDRSIKVETLLIRGDDNGPDMDQLRQFGRTEKINIFTNRALDTLVFRLQLIKSS